MTENAKQEISFGSELTPEVEAAYRKRIEEAKLRGGVNALKEKTPLGHVERPNMPNFSQLQGEKARTGVLSPETAQQLQDAAAAVQKDVAAKKEEETKETEKKDEDDILGLFDFNSQNEADRILNNKKRRADIESRCLPMNFEDLLIKDEVQQIIPILPGKFEPKFRSLCPEENLFIKRYMSKDSHVSDQYILEKYSICQLTCALISINGKMLPDHRDKDGSPDEPLFESKLKIMLKKSGYIMADLAVNYYWFDLRVRKLINPEALGNG